MHATAVGRLVMTDDSSAGGLVCVGGNLLRGGRVENGNQVRRLVLVKPDDVAVGILHREVAAERILFTNQAPASD